ncbi:glucose-6-phosphate isomerase [Desulfurobacterium pacificum]|uniref:Glucose-6-phosphate isomerase n=1 Tax=Desulfurobacterium pacificum TaxID=240166 RepID=A0ABY1NV01_9BACT|nr:glucose-6-phosphate isomerase [Desulfurobacterium pacificum]SMP19093.1 glucose-6-phosphate isomerase [Desulfurobacterium pacificum]
MRVEFFNWKLKDVEKPKTDMPFSHLPWEDLEEWKDVSEDMRSRFETMVIVGIGGSSLGTKTVYEALRYKATRKLLFIDNVDPLLISETLRTLDWENTCFFFASKSGKTLETVTVLNVILRELRSRNLPLKDRVIFVGDKGNSFEELSRKFNTKFVPVPSEIGGRFSVFTAISVIPCFYAGFDCEVLLKGGELSLKEIKTALNLAVWKYENYMVGRKNSVLMPYTSYLREFTEWYSQLWAESLGKNGKGQTPVKAVGTSSQHSILQLFIDGPDDKLYQFFMVERFPADYRLPENVEILEYLSNKRISEVIKAEFEGTLQSLIMKGRPVVVFTLKRLEEFELGYLFMTYMVATVKMAELLGVNPYGQPAVELGKKVAKEILSS